MRDDLATKPNEPAYTRTRSCLRCGADLTLGFIPPSCEAHGHVPHDARAWLTLERDYDEAVSERGKRTVQIEDAHEALGWCDREWTNAHDLGACLIEGIAALRAKTSAAQVDTHGASSIRAPGQGDAPIRSGAPPTNSPISAREHARHRGPLDGADAQALEHALTITERERDEARRERDVARALVGAHPDDRIVLASAHRLSDPEWESATVERAFAKVRDLTRERDGARADLASAESAIDSERAFVASLFEVAGKHGIRPDDEKLGDFIERLASERDALAWAANPASRCAEQPCPCECHRTDIDEPAPHVEGCIFHEGRASELTPEDELPW